MVNETDDELKAILKSWETKDDEEMRLIHLKLLLNEKYLEGIRTGVFLTKMDKGDSK